MLRRATRTIGLVAAATVGLLTLAVGIADATPYPTIVAHTTNALSNGPVVVGIGDSILEGHGVDSGQAWLAVLAEKDGWRLTNLASDGSGFATVGDNGDTFADQVMVAEKLNPDVVIISGSSNDLGATDVKIAQATTATIDALRAALPNAKIVAVSAVWGDTPLPDQMTTITADVAAATIAVGGSYLDIGQPLSAQPTLMQADDDHPTAEGQGILAASVSAAMAAASLGF